MTIRLSVNGSDFNREIKKSIAINNSAKNIENNLKTSISIRF